MPPINKTNPGLCLKGLTVLVTRPAAQADNLCHLINERGGQTIRLPVTEIVANSPSAELKSQLAELPDYDLAIFNSTNAVVCADALIDIKKNWSKDLHVAAVGKKTAASLIALGLLDVVTPKLQFDSAALLELDLLQDVEGKRIMIFSGEGGRTLLADTLKKRGALIYTARLYKRMLPKGGFAPIEKEIQQDLIHMTTATSNELLDNLLQMADPDHYDWLLDKPIAVFSKRTAKLALELGFDDILVADNACDEDLVSAIEQWYALD